MTYFERVLISPRFLEGKFAEEVRAHHDKKLTAWVINGDGPVPCIFESLEEVYMNKHL